jgi:hypothetical protein
MRAKDATTLYPYSHWATNGAVRRKGVGILEHFIPCRGNNAICCSPSILVTEEIRVAAAWAPRTCTSKFNEALPGSTPTYVQYKISDHLVLKKLAERYDHPVKTDEPNPSVAVARRDCHGSGVDKR